MSGVARRVLPWLCAMGLSACGNHGNAPVEQPAVTSSTAALQHAQAIKASAPAAAVSTATTPRPVDPLAQAGFGGYGDLHFGISEADFRRSWGELNGGKAAPGSTCKVLYPIWVKRTPRDISFLFEDDKFARYDVANAKETAPGGGKVGMSETQIRALYPNLQKSPQKYEEGAFDLRVPGDGGSTLLFALGKDGKVSAWRVGVAPQIDYVEGCG
ncbi:lectin [Dyella sp.]|uniref:lectin n=1 Tax=Dyella sp. TaxID=1869338 RepID=UPI002ED51D6F